MATSLGKADICDEGNLSSLSKAISRLFFFTRKIQLTILSLKGDYLCVVFGRMTYGLYHTNSLVWTQDAQDSEYARLMIAIATLLLSAEVTRRA